MLCEQVSSESAKTLISELSTRQSSGLAEPPRLARATVGRWCNRESIVDLCQTSCSCTRFKVLPDGPLSLTRAAAVSSLWCHLTSDAAVALATKRGLRIKSDDCDRKWNKSTTI